MSVSVTTTKTQASKIKASEITVLRRNKSFSKLDCIKNKVIRDDLHVFDLNERVNITHNVRKNT